VQKEFNNTVEIKKSKFITYICPYNEFDSIMIRLKKQHPKARHFVYAYRYLNNFEQIVENSSDDGEPKGTSAKPSLAVLSGLKLINTAVIIVRYFGGIKLGTGGLVRAYSLAVHEVCNNSEFIVYEKLLIFKIQTSYSNLSKLKYNLQQANIHICKEEFFENIQLDLQTTQEKFDAFDKSLFL
jgi:uncharacterized YigZ family protein